MTKKIRGFLLLGAMIPALSQAQVLRITSFTRDPLTGNGSLTWTNQPANVYCSFLGAGTVDDVWIPTGNPWWNILTTNTTTTLQIPTSIMSRAQGWLRIVCATNPVTLHYTNIQVPFASITVDGQTSDWSGIQPAVTDPVGDAKGGPAGSDLTALYLARDSANAYVRIDVANGPPDSTVAYKISFYTNCVFCAGDRYVGIFLWSHQCSVAQYTSSTSGASHTTVAVGTLAISGNVIEASVPLGALNPPSPSYVRVGTDVFDTTSYVEATFP